MLLIDPLAATDLQSTPVSDPAKANKSPNIYHVYSADFPVDLRNQLTLPTLRHFRFSTLGKKSMYDFCPRPKIIPL